LREIRIEERRVSIENAVKIRGIFKGKFLKIVKIKFEK
jgi:hypothetical protein